MEDQPFFHVPRNPDDPRTRIDISLGSASISASQEAEIEGFRRVASSHRSKESSKRRLRVQNRPAGCVLSRTYSSQQQKVPQVHLRKQGVPVSSATIRSKYSPSGFHSIGAHGDRLSAPSGDLGDTISRRLVNSPSGPYSFTPTSSSANEYARPCRLCTKQKEIRAGPNSGSPVSRNPFTSGLRGSSLPESKAWEIVARARHLSSLHVLSYIQVSQLMGSLNWASGLIPLGRLYLRPFNVIFIH